MVRIVYNHDYISSGGYDHLISDIHLSNTTARAIGASTLLECGMMTYSQGTTGIVAATTAGAVAATGTFNNNVALFLNVSYKSAATTTTSTFQLAAWEVLEQ